MSEAALPAQPPDPGAPVGLAHVAIAVRDADAACRLFEAAFGAVRGREGLLDEGALRVVFLELGSLTLELLEPREGHSVARFLEKRGEGLHHICLAVPDLERALSRCRSAGISSVDATPRTGARGSRVSFLHPKGAAGVLIELREEPR